MPPSRTPRALPRQTARPQFASTPRFLFTQRASSQRKEPGNNDYTLLKDDVDVISNLHPTPTPARETISRQKEVIEDSSSDLELEQDYNQTPKNDTSGLLEDIPSSPPPDTTEVDAEFEELFGPKRHPSKRRRASIPESTTLGTPKVQKRRPYDDIETSSPVTSPYGWTFAANAALNHEPPSPSLPHRTTPRNLRTSLPQPLAPTPASATPATAKPSVHSYSRFLVSSASRPPPKPTFVLPRPSSPEQTGDLGPYAIPTPFSPSSHPLRRRGRQRSPAPSYLPGGMASEVRSWILEMGTKREQQMQMASGRGHTSANVCSADPSKYSYVLRISDVRQSALGSCGPLAFIRGQVVATTSVSSENSMHDSGLETNGAGTDTRNVLLMGAPRLHASELRPSSGVPSLQAGNLVGILRWLVWEIPGMQACKSSVSLPAEHRHEQIWGDESERSSELEFGGWLVGMEWEIIQSV
ncbi:hypothetical protein AN4582.2 [Aspergillus nidulans FGSC A4]|uniref:Uncharacterized protein n=1 Tax=Emericella nidulans (strain FGSC A4 / ATCC 38163 / CBS 112.46 / NRRL 194 / M139) TaxID=227321 RepID=Q5B4E8_EMENI|nr:hypothetical protein [Aspergillus nidulans FGSC A4]EAA60925.1 hypothetical protein AN4582.2 [Aspergillus nidulans FGSC A4]CBF77211.1 TPA: conserved hypothetical protein [Aspergillus nidulans FGSC A4]|eukprot:XP_662186.1 hypothetical protein AN4582.2 [Aspergillus nidulans FGSC A4]